MVRVRFAPSPTGPLHIGGVRTALYNYLLARKLGGTLILRIEDTDQTRFVAGAEAYIIESLRWLGIEFDEGQGVGGPHAPYRQSERLQIYGQYAQKLIDEGKAYYAFDTADELDAMRERMQNAGVDPAYNGITRLQMKNSLTLPASQVQEMLQNKAAHVIRVKVPLKEEIRFKDAVRDWVTVHSSALDDKVLMKSDGMPTYHLANIVDDHLMEITHVIRGEEWLPSAPLHVLLYRLFGWDAPQFAHLPLLLKPEGNGKLSKRDGDLGDFPVFPLQWQDPTTGKIARGFREDGYLPEALTNFLAFLGWNPGTEQELFSVQELIEAFSLDRIHRAGARFDVAKAKWYNQQYLKHKSDADLAQFVAHPDALKIVRLMKDRVTFPAEMLTDAPFLTTAPTDYEKAVAETKWNDDAKKVIAGFVANLNAHHGEFSAEAAKEILGASAEQAGIKQGRILQALRLAVTGLGHGPDLMLTMEILGKTETIQRLERALTHL